MIILGMMTGTSCDGLDASCVRFRGHRPEILWTESLPYPRRLRQRVLELQVPGTALASRDWLQLDAELGMWYAASALKLLVRRRSTAIDAIANHGQTVAHFPKMASLQLGEPAWIAAATGLTVLSHFRSGDIAGGGQGAPLVPGFHARLAAASGLDRTGCSIHNLGGISNLTYLHRHHEPLAWDTGPANLWIDHASFVLSNGRLKFDAGGRLAASGTPDERRVRRLLLHPHFKARPPKSTGRDDFTGIELMKVLRGLELRDAVATATLATARSIARDYDRWIFSRRLPLSTVLFCGGGARNVTLLHQIEHELGQLGHHPYFGDTELLGVTAQSMESAAFAHLGMETLRGNSLGGSWTGAHAGSPPARITPGKNWAALLKKLRS